ncbi:MAG TPA: DUF547 domain-containing protein [Gemmatimonadota bacterium]|nr:DUF547 domain-containing protein [Gemmatimonadota bacterium]
MPLRLAVAAMLLWPAALTAQAGTDPADAYADYGHILQGYVLDGRVDYARLAREDPPEWRRFLAWLDDARPDGWGLEERRAFWINAYNARVIAGVLRHYPIQSVREVGFLGGRVRGFFGRRDHRVAGRRWTLDEIEKEILLQPPLFEDRIHWALNCASEGCPRLRAEPYRAGMLDTQLDFQARTFLNSPSGHRLDRDARTLYLTRIFHWYADDFRSAAESVREYAARYLTGAAAAAARDPDWSIEYLEYDWSLNQAR